MSRCYFKGMRVRVHSSAWVAMLEAYADFQVLGRMEMFYAKITNSKAFLRMD